MERDRSQTHFVVVVVVDTIFRKRGLGTQTLVLLEDLNRQNMNKCGTNLQFYSMIFISWNDIQLPLEMNLNYINF